MNLDRLLLKRVYLDNSATTVVCDEAAKKVFNVMTKQYGNPSSLHSMGLEAENEIDIAREVIAKKINCNTDEIYFTSGGTESNNLAVFGVVNARKRHGNKLVTTSIEHSSILGPFKELAKQGFEIVFINPDKSGGVSKEQLYNAIDSSTIFVSCMMTNNEVGSILPVEDLKKIVKQKKSPAMVHVDAVQSFCKMNFNVKKLDVDLLSMSSHKIHGPKGVGALYISKGVKVNPILFGGEQQNKIRPGTEAVPLIAGFAEAVRLNSSYEHVKELRDYCIKNLKRNDNVVINSSEASFPYILNFSLPGIKSETMLHFLASKNIFVSSGSACNKGKRSHVLESMGLPKEIIDSAIRVSFSRYNTIEDVDFLLESINEGMKVLVKNRRGL